MEHREFICVRAPALRQEDVENTAFLQEVQAALLAALEARGLISRAQYESCLDALARPERGGGRR